MKKIIYLIPLFFASQSFSQASFKGRLFSLDSTLKVDKINIYLYFRNSLIAKTNSDSLGNFTFKNVNPGLYSIAIHATGYRRSWHDSINIISYKDYDFFNLFYSGKCILDGKPSCIDGHTDHIMPIVYRAPTKEDRKKAQKGLIYLFTLPDYFCDPGYYCTIHKIKL
ncbi:MAG: carboxypeptidase regulatory-like domain-containing protein [Bacteroidetes bacterium]|nr:carboxypeptidase regulatory-like domain-containing protein [Bacteroidota bacterium]